MRAGQQRANLRDIAEASGVSIQTVSRVVRGVDVVAEATRARVLEAIERLNYQPNLAARSLSAARTGSVHIIDAVPLFHGHATSFVAICQALSNLELHTSTSVFGSPDIDHRELHHLVPVSADGVIVLGGRAESRPWIDTIASRLPTVCVGETKDLPSPAVGVAVDHRAGAVAAVDHLISRGAQRILHVAGPQDWIDAQERLEGYKLAMGKAGLEPTVLFANSWDASAAAALVPDLPPDVDAIFAANDQLALGAMSALQLAGRRVPGDVRVVGYDDVPGSEWFLPGLTTVRQDFFTMGEQAVKALNLLLNGEPAESSLITPTLIVRDST
ncbi:LacI family DNA-binding transcriptional regulator [Tessaracoccus sp. MC1756]|uniref:LacI family DNA-binding transcriptional regulator n=1 Tax=Tessaracoccus sp. MC1756 TaxID=2760311 RepID=UPI0015FFA548|nr:LacI family DNA-binding transcriptional regulator [Tessaracoccus sp. MC1756]MBB1509851.1 LacI family DNA-binding transcriptional regulator [Tessaracoccus sp. MC1756]